jgi:hypothetical protein
MVLIVRVAPFTVERDIQLKSPQSRERHSDRVQLRRAVAAYVSLFTDELKRGRRGN